MAKTPVKFEIGADTFQIKPLDTFTASEFIARLGPAALTLFGALSMSNIQAAARQMMEPGDESKSEQAAVDRASAAITITGLVPVAEAIAAMGEENRRYIITETISRVEYLTESGTWAPVFNKEVKRWIFDQFDSMYYTGQFIMKLIEIDIAPFYSGRL